MTDADIRVQPEPAPLTQEELDALAAEQAAMGAEVPAVCRPSSRGQFSQPRELDPTTFQQMERHMGSGRARSGR